jgi:hypothetical protein
MVFGMKSAQNRPEGLTPSVQMRSATRRATSRAAALPVTSAAASRPAQVGKPLTNPVIIWCHSMVMPRQLPICSITGS